MSDKPIPLGSEVKCVVSGVTGIASSRSYRLNGNIQYAVQPKSADGLSMPDAWNIDHQSLVVIGSGVRERAVEPKASVVEFALGSMLRDKASGFEGMAVSRTIYLNGCVSYGIVPTAKKNALLSDAPGENFMMVERLELVSKGRANEVESSRSSIPTGGPSSRAQRL